MPLRTIVLWLGFVATIAGPGHAHFLWLASDNGRVLAFFGESAAQRDYPFPGRLAEIAVSHRSAGATAPVPLHAAEEANFTGLMSDEITPLAGVVETTASYGIYHGTLLTYYAKHYLSADPAEWQALGGSKAMRLDIVPQSVGERLELQVLWDGNPAANTAVTLVGEKESQTTDAQGKVSFPSSPSGWLAVLVRVIEENRKGELEGAPFTSATHYASLTIRHAQPSQANANPPTQESKSKSDSHGGALLPLPIAVASFGAAVCDQHLYVYGGHVGAAHAHSRDNLSSNFWRIPLTPNAAWETLPVQASVQGLALVAHRGLLYRIGGMTARNAAGEDDDLHSTSDFCRFDPQSKSWEELPPLPAPRSSHDAVVVGDLLYVIGGWKLAGTGEGEWHNDCLVIDLAPPSPVWSRVPDPPFQRRALAIGNLGEKLVVVGGMDPSGTVSRDVDIYDPASSEWSAAPPLPGDDMNGFGVSAWNLAGQLFVSGSNGTVYRLKTTDGGWEVAGQLHQARFFHRLLPYSDQSMIALGGAGGSKHLSDIEIFVPDSQP